MRKTILVLMAVSAITFVGCQKEEPVMSEFQALQCLQKGTYEIEYPNSLTNYSAVYNPVELTVLFNVHNDMSQIYKIDFERDFQ